MLTLEALAELLAKDHTAATAVVKEFALGATFFPFNSRPALMGVINLSPDSWYRESVSLTARRAIERGLILRSQGADIVDVGAESTLGHSERVTEENQRARLGPVVAELSAEGVLVSVETYDATVASDALRRGAKILNLTGTAQNEAIYRLAAEYEAAVIICYVQGAHVRATEDLVSGADPISMMREYFVRELDLANKVGATRLIIDPGLGFYYRNLQDSAQRVRRQMNIFLNTFRLRSLGYPVCHALPHAFEFFAEEVRTAEPVFAVLAALGKTDLFRTHEVPKVRAVLELLQAFDAGSGG